MVDLAVTATSLFEGSVTGEVMTMREKPTLAVISPAASAQMEGQWSIYNDHGDGIYRQGWCQYQNEGLCHWYIFPKDIIYSLVQRETWSYFLDQSIQPRSF